MKIQDRVDVHPVLMAGGAPGATTATIESKRDCLMATHRKTASGSPRAATTATLHADGRVTVPRVIRAELSLLPGDKLTFSLSSNGDLIMRKAIAKLAKIPHRSR